MDTTSRQRFPQFYNSCVGDFRAGEADLSQAGEALEVCQPRIRDLRVVEVERAQAGEPFKVFYPGICDLRVPEVESSRFRFNDNKLTAQRLNRGYGLVFRFSIQCVAPVSEFLFRKVRSASYENGVPDSPRTARPNSVNS